MKPQHHFTPLLTKAIQQIVAITGTFKDALTTWLASAENGITDLYADIIHAHEVHSDELCAGSTCVNEAQLAAILAGTAAGAATAEGGNAGAPSGSPASGDADSTLTLNGNDPVAWQMGTPWQDNLGALFTHVGQSETIYSTSTVDVTVSGTTTIDYWAAVPASGPSEWLHTTRDIVIEGVANDNGAVANDNEPVTTTTASSTAQ